MALYCHLYNDYVKYKIMSKLSFLKKLQRAIEMESRSIQDCPFLQFCNFWGVNKLFPCDDFLYSIFFVFFSFVFFALGIYLTLFFLSGTNNHIGVTLKCNCGDRIFRWKLVHWISVTLRLIMAPYKITGTLGQYHTELRMVDNLLYITVC